MSTASVVLEKSERPHSPPLSPPLWEAFQVVSSARKEHHNCFNDCHVLPRTQPTRDESLSCTLLERGVKLLLALSHT